MIAGRGCGFVSSAIEPSLDRAVLRVHCSSSSIKPTLNPTPQFTLDSPWDITRPKLRTGSPLPIDPNRGCGPFWSGPRCDWCVVEVPKGVGLHGPCARVRACCDGPTTHTRIDTVNSAWPDHRRRSQADSSRSRRSSRCRWPVGIVRRRGERHRHHGRRANRERNERGCNPMPGPQFWFSRVFLLSLSVLLGRKPYSRLLVGFQKSMDALTPRFPIPRALARLPFVCHAHSKTPPGPSHTNTLYHKQP